MYICLCVYTCIYMCVYAVLCVCVCCVYMERRVLVALLEGKIARLLGHVVR